jgi:phosphatidate cytidylyltransferase
MTFAKRLISSILLWAVLLSVLFFLPAPASALLCCLVSTLALWEFYDMLLHGGKKCGKRFWIVGGIILSSGTWYFCANRPEFTTEFEITALILLVLVMFLRQLGDRTNTDNIQMISNTLFGILYIPLLFNFLPKIKYMYSGANGDSGPGWLLVFLLVAVTKFCDTGAYLIGRLFGRHKMIPRISPNKTWEGVLGGFVVAVAASISVFYYLEDRISAIGFNQTHAVILGVLLGGLGILGDLGESLLKRDAQVKDSGELVPGIGGILDLIDSLLFTAPALYIYLVLFVKP